MFTGGPYSAYAGHDATRALATFSVKDVKEEYDDLSDLSSMQMDSVREWEMQFTGEIWFIKYLYCKINLMEIHVVYLTKYKPSPTYHRCNLRQSILMTKNIIDFRMEGSTVVTHAV